MASLQDIRRRIKSVKSIQQITNAMTIERMIQSRTSPVVNVKMEVEPNKVLQMSPERLVDAEKTFISK